MEGSTHTPEHGTGRLNGGPVDVLIVDDQEAFRSALRDLVCGTPGMTLVGEATSGEGALEAVERLMPAMVIMDVRMPGIGGVEATRQLTEAHPGILVLLVSVEPGDPEVVRSSGAGAFLRKQQLSTHALRDAWQAHVR
jgi:DNA-binding NarL/FixJ family response regulator